MQRGLSASLAFYEAAILNAGAFFGCYVCGLTADSGFGSFNSLTTVTFACGMAAFGWIGAKSVAGITVWTIVYGFLSGAIQAIFSPCISMLAPTPELIGSWNGEAPKNSCHRGEILTALCPGICIFVSSFAVLGTGPIGGRLLTNTGGISYLPMQLFTGVCLTVATTLLICTRLWVSRAMWI